MLTYEPDNLTISVEAGMTLAELQALLATNGQMLPLERADAAVVTLGELVATAADGPRSLGYATLRDWTLGLTLVEADGTLVRVGAQVVKNVTGYNLTRLLVGSRGTLGIIAAVSLRLFPRPPAAATLEIACGERARAFALLDDLALSRLLPVAVEYLEGRGGPLPGGPRLYVRAEGHAAAVARHLAELGTLAARHGATVTAELRGAAEEACWRNVAMLAAGELPAASSRLRLCAAPAELGAALEQAAALAAAHAVELTLGARALLGVAYLWADGPPEALAAWQGTLATHWPHLARLAGPGVNTARPLWEQGPAAGLAGALKAALDPAMALG